MKVAASLAEYTAAARQVRSGASAGRTDPPVALVPTMGALHEGHRSLIRLARARAERVVVSIFVNPLQFGAGEDFARYPRPLADDLAVCEAEGVDVVLAPQASDLYAADRQVTVSAGALGQVLEGASRPRPLRRRAHRGAQAVPYRLAGLAVFGQKDAQQLACIRRMVRDLNLDVEVLGAPIVRDPDGLALSSRKVYLSPASASWPAVLSVALEKAGTQSVRAGGRAAGVRGAGPGG
jgi:pantoate--beta-alanine ligase